MLLPAGRALAPATHNMNQYAIMKPRAVLLWRENKSSIVAEVDTSIKGAQRNKCAGCHISTCG